MVQTAALRKPAREDARAQPDAEPARTPAREAINPNALKWTDPATGRTFSRHMSSMSDDVLDFPPHLVPDGFTYQWVRKSTWNQEDKVNLMGRARNGWQIVPQDRHPDRVVEHDGLILMEAPTVFVNAVREEERKRAMNVKRTSLPCKNVALPSGYDTNTRGAQANTFARVGSPEPTDPSWRPAYKRDVDIDG